MSERRGFDVRSREEKRVLGMCVVKMQEQYLKVFLAFYLFVQ